MRLIKGSFTERYAVRVPPGTPHIYSTVDINHTIPINSCISRAFHASHTEYKICTVSSLSREPHSEFRDQIEITGHRSVVAIIIMTEVELDSSDETEVLRDLFNCRLDVLMHSSRRLFSLEIC